MSAHDKYRARVFARWLRRYGPIRIQVILQCPSEPDAE
jgi:hypothetical protein